MNTRIKKSISILTVSALLAGAFTGCSLFDGKKKEAITEVLTSYFSKVSEAAYDEAKKFVVGKDDYFNDNAFTGMQEALVNAVLPESEFTVGEITIDKTSATAEVTVTMPDLESAAEPGCSFDDFIVTIPDISDTVEETLEFELTNDDDEWLIEPASTEAFYEFCASIGEGIEFDPLNTYSAREAVDTFIACLSNGDFEGAVLMTPYGDSAMGMFGELTTLTENLPDLGNFISLYFSDLIYALEVTEVTDDHITVSLSGSAPNMEAMINVALENREELINTAAAYIESQTGGGQATIAIATGVLNSIVDNLDPADIVNMDGTFTVAKDANGNLTVEPGSDLLPFSFEI